MSIELEEHIQSYKVDDRAWLRAQIAEVESLRIQLADFKEALKSVMPYLELENDLRTAFAVYIPPAQRLRNAADALEAKERIILAARELLAGK